MDNDLLKKRILELDRTAYTRNIPTHSLFLTPEEQDTYLRMKEGDFHSPRRLWGGWERAERQAVFFLPDYMEDSQTEGLGLVWVQIAPAHEKFAEDLSHRDYLGAIMSLGMERDRTGDILVDHKVAYVAVMEEMAEYLCESLTEVRHTKVVCQVTSLPEALAEPKYESRQGSVSSERLDALVSLAFRLSRGDGAAAIKAGYVFVNGKQILSPSQVVKEEDIVSVRHRGRFVYRGITAKSKKGRYIVAFDVAVS